MRSETVRRRSGGDGDAEVGGGEPGGLGCDGDADGAGGGEHGPGGVFGWMAVGVDADAEDVGAEGVDAESEGAVGEQEAGGGVGGSWECG